MKKYLTKPNYDGTYSIRSIDDAGGTLRTKMEASMLSGVMAFEVCDLLKGINLETIHAEAVWLCWMIDPKWNCPTWAPATIRDRKPRQVKIAEPKKKKAKPESEALTVTD